MGRRVTTAVLLALAVLTAGTAGFMAIEGWSVLDAAYMTVMTVWTVGFQEVHPLSPAGRVFTMALVLGGVGALAFAAGTFVEYMVEGHLREMLEERRMKKALHALSGHLVIAGLGRVGSVVARTLQEAGVDFVVIDRNEEALASAETSGWLHVHGEAADEDVLRAAGVDRASALVCALDTDADNTFVTLTARTMNPALRVVARSSSESAEETLRRAGAERVITPSVLSGRRMAAMVLHPVVSNYLELVAHSDRIPFRIEEVVVGSASRLAGVPVGDARVRERTGAHILAVISPDGDVAEVRPETVLAAGDRLITLGSSSQLEALSGML